MADLRIDRVQLQIEIGNDKARRKMRELEGDVKKYTKELKKLERQGKQNTEEYKKAEDALKKTKQAHDQLVESIGIENLSIKELTRRQQELNRIMRDLDPNSAAYARYSAQLKKVSARLTQLRTDARETRTAFARLADRFNRFESIFTWMTAAIVGVVYEINVFIRSISEMSDVMGEVMKTTGLTLEQVRQLKQEFKDFGTRTASKDLLNIAYQAGKLGMKSMEEIKGFVKEADIAVVSLGKALGDSAEETINTLGKIIGAFQLDQTMGWEKAMRHTGALVNELGKQSTASEQEVVNYMARLASVGVSLKIPMENIAAIGATLSSLKVPAEQGSTAMQRFLFVIASESEKMSKFLGISEARYKAMVEDDIMGVMDMLLRTAKEGNTGLFKMVQQLDAMDVSGVRMTNTVAQLINNVDKLGAQTRIAADEMKRGTSTLNEFNIMNNTFAARMAKVRKEVNSVVYGLGKQLEPAIISIAESFATFLKWLQRNADTLLFLAKTIIVATTAIVSYNMATKLAVLWTNRAAAATILKTAAEKAAVIGLRIYIAATNLLSAATHMLRGRTLQATTAMRSFNTVTRMNPIGLLVTLIGAATAAYFAFRKEQEEVIDQHKELKDKYADTRTEMMMEFEQLKRTTTGTHERSEAVKRINARYKEYLPNLIAENASLNDINAAQEQAIKLMDNRLKMEIRLADIKKVMKQEYELEKQLYMEAYPAMQKALDDMNKSVNSGQFEDRMADRAYVLAKAQVDALEADMERIRKQKDILFAGLEGLPQPRKSDNQQTLGGTTGQESSWVQKLLAEAKTAAEKVNGLLDDAIDDITVSIKLDPDEELKNKWQAFKDALGAEPMSELDFIKQAADEEVKIAKEKEEKKKAIREEAWKGATKLLGAFSQYNQAAMNNELAAAGDNEEKKELIRKKYARRQQAIDITEAIINQAKGITAIWAKWAEFPPVAAALTAIEIAATGAQIAFIRSQQFAKGRYNVQGADDNRIYKDVPFIGSAKTGIVNRPALISEQGSEGIVDHRTLFSRRADQMGMTAMDHFRAITALRYNAPTVPQHAEGVYDVAGTAGTQAAPTANFATRDELAQVLAMVADSNAANRAMVQNLRVSINAREIQDTNDKVAAIENRADA